MDKEFLQALLTATTDNAVLTTFMYLRGLIESIKKVEDEAKRPLTSEELITVFEMYINQTIELVQGSIDKFTK